MRVSSGANGTAAEQRRPSYPETSDLSLRINEPGKGDTQKERLSASRKVFYPHILVTIFKVSVQKASLGMKALCGDLRVTCTAW